MYKSVRLLLNGFSALVFLVSLKYLAFITTKLVYAELSYFNYQDHSNL